MRKILMGCIPAILILVFWQTNNVLAETDYYGPALKSISVLNNQENFTYDDIIKVQAEVDNRDYKVSTMNVIMKNTSSMASFRINLSYNSKMKQWIGERKIDEPSWLNSSWIVEQIVLKDGNENTRIYWENDRYLISHDNEMFNWNDLQIDIVSPVDSSKVLEKTYQGTEWKNIVIDLTSDFTNDGTLIIENTIINANGYSFVNNGTIILKGENTIYSKDGWSGYRWSKGYGEVILKGVWFNEIGTETTVDPKVNRVTNNNEKITGNGEIGAIVNVYNNETEELIGTGKVKDDTNFTVQLEMERYRLGQV